MGTCVSIRNLLEEKHIKVLDSLPITLIRSFNKCLLTIYYVRLQTVKDREAWCAAVHGETESNTTEGLNNSSYVPGTRYPGKKKKVKITKGTVPDSVRSQFFFLIDFTEKLQ